jgi:hypothetical protein
MPSLLLREGKVAEAREAVKHMPMAPHTIGISSKRASKGPQPNWMGLPTKR